MNKLADEIDRFYVHIEDMRTWLIECFPDNEEDIEDLTADQTLFYLEKYWDGGVADYIRANDIDLTDYAAEKLSSYLGD